MSRGEGKPGASPDELNGTLQQPNTKCNSRLDAGRGACLSGLASSRGDCRVPYGVSSYSPSFPHIHRHSRESGNPEAIGNKCVLASHRILDSRFRGNSGNNGNRRLETYILKLTTLPGASIRGLSFLGKLPFRTGAKNPKSTSSTSLECRFSSAMLFRGMTATENPPRPVRSRSTGRRRGSCRMSMKTGAGDDPPLQVSRAGNAPDATSATVPRKSVRPWGSPGREHRPKGRCARPRAAD